MIDTKRYNGMMLPLLILAVLTVILILSGGCGCNTSFSFVNLSSPDEGEAPSGFVSSHLDPVVEVYHFHATQQCYSCRVLGELAEEAISTRFANNLSDGTLIFAHVNAELPENADLVSRYGVTSSSLMIGYTNETGFLQRIRSGSGISWEIKRHSLMSSKKHSEE